MKWFRNLDLIDVPLVFKSDLEEKDRERFKTIIEGGDLDKVEKIPLEECRVEEEYSPGDIRITTSCIDKPLWVKVSYFPNWQADGADLYLASPSFMLVYPRQKNVRIYYGDTSLDILGAILSWGALAFVIIYLLRKKLSKLAFKPKPQQVGKHFGRVNKIEG
jgi:hypothetical protein